MCAPEKSHVYIRTIKFLAQITAYTVYIHNSTFTHIAHCKEDTVRALAAASLERVVHDLRDVHHPIDGNGVASLSLLATGGREGRREGEKGERVGETYICSYIIVWTSLN